MEREELHRIRRYTFRSELDKALHSLEGIIKGITLDGVVESAEVDELRAWAKQHYQYIARHPFNEIVPLIMKSVEDNHVDPEEAEDILWISHNVVTENRYYDVVSANIQRLHGILHGILADGKITDDEIHALSGWLFDNEDLKGTYPFDELCSLVAGICSDGVIDESERSILKLFISDFAETANMEHLDRGEIDRLRKEISITAVFDTRGLREVLLPTPALADWVPPPSREAASTANPASEGAP